MASIMAMPTNVSRDSVQRIHRITRENRSLWYQLTVLQQPERARACGSGMKANSDRRPVDPPPVVELRIIEGPTVEEGKDITFDYNANFFLYASLEQARTLAHGRVQSAAATNPPILTGVPASGVAYLDRPAEAGYFIFPDLSVRHEGYFRLAFSLFETTKEEKDFDTEPADPDLPSGVDWRMEIKTQPFNVFSAKKFPGLMESTQLSKTVADQGCRVRIRRDVRMRKRDGKGVGYERREDEYRRRTVTPASDDHLHSIRGRSLSNSSDHHMTYSSDVSRRPSGVDPYHPPPAPPAPGYEMIPSSRTLSHFAPCQPGHPANDGHFAPTPPTALHRMAPAPAPYHPSTLPAPYGKPEQGSYGYMAESFSSACPSPTMAFPTRPEQQHQYERSAGGCVQPSPPSCAAHQQSKRMSYHNVAYSSGPTMEPQQPQHQQKSPARPTTAASSLSPLKIAHLVSPSPLPPIEPQAQHAMAVPALLTGDKRKRDHVFPHASRPLHNGQRQDDAQVDRTDSTNRTLDGRAYSRASGHIEFIAFHQSKP